ncbi:zf-HC2 domain-containing protein [Streptomyces sp. CC208A]|uniref:zf-HC2 domain-containing protein n=1 Tax=Streptomyces sp. CC208A TaxID=3044573 RepID=UPI0024A86CFF|nr:zf-HC2 domain-containing protein [Streptomyces sp. CC208A]
MITCSEATKRLWEYLDATLGAADRATLEEHLAGCLRCCGELEFAGELRSFLAAAGREEIPGDVLRRLNRVLEELEP